MSLIVAGDGRTRPHPELRRNLWPARIHLELRDAALADVRRFPVTGRHGCSRRRRPTRNRHGCYRDYDESDRSAFHVTLLG